MALILRVYHLRLVGSVDALTTKNTLHTLPSPAYLACDTTCLQSPDERSEVGAGDQTPGTTP